MFELLMPAFLGVIFLIIPLVLIMRRRSVINNGVRTNAVVVKSVAVTMVHGRLVVSEAGKNSPRALQHPIFRYTTAEGREYEVRYKVGYQKPKYKDGETVEIIYHIDDPERITIANEKVYLILACVFGFIGFNLILLGGIFFVIFS